MERTYQEVASPVKVKEKIVCGNCDLVNKKSFINNSFMSRFVDILGLGRTAYSGFLRRNFINLRRNKINADDVITFCLYLMSKMRRNLIKIRSCAIFSWFRFSSYFKVDKRLRFRLVS